jgi:hypothetical protein
MFSNPCVLGRLRNASHIRSYKKTLGSDVHDFDVTIVESWTPRLEYFMYKTYAELRLVSV